MHKLDQFSFKFQDKSGINSEAGLKDEETSDKVVKSEEELTTTNDNQSLSSKENLPGGKKDPFLRRQELLIKSGLAEVCYLVNFYIYFVFFLFFVVHFAPYFLLGNIYLIFKNESTVQLGCLIRML